MKSKKIIQSLLGKPTMLYEKFHQDTKLGFKFPKQEYKIFSAPSRIAHKEYLRLEKIVLPTPQDIKIPLTKTLRNRLSTRDFSKDPISLKTLSQLLFFAAGVTRQGKRPYPSAGALYPLEVYLLSQRTDIPKGLYHYNIRLHVLEILTQTIPSKVIRTLFIQESIKNAPCILFITARFPRNTVKYGNRGYRHVLQEVGHLSQNIYLLSCALDIGCVSIGGFKDDAVNTLLVVDGLEETVINVIAVGRKNKKSLTKEKTPVRLK